MPNNKLYIKFWSWKLGFLNLSCLDLFDSNVNKIKIKLFLKVLELKKEIDLLSTKLKIVENLEENWTAKIMNFKAPEFKSIS